MRNSVMGNPLDRATQWRGRVHQLAFVAAIPAGIALIAVSRTPKAKVASAIYALSLVGLYGASSLYNRCLSTPRLRPWMRWVDHAMIYVLIAGSYTPICLLVAPKPWGVVAIIAIWFAAAAGVVVKVTKLRKVNKLGMAWYLVMGWAALLILPLLVGRMSTTALVLLGGGGLLYTLGAVVVVLKRPNPSKRLFGYHEVWHSFVVAASVCHYAMQWLTVSSA
jgi:hemolysin III